MKLAVPIAALAILTAGCATLGSGDPVALTRHESAVGSLQVPKVKPTQLAAGPLQLVRVMYEPGTPDGRASLWISADPACPYGEAPALAEVTAFNGWYGSESVDAGRFLCAATTQGEADSKLVWWSQGAATRSN